MAADLRASFKDMQHKWLSEPIKVVAHPTKRPYSDEVHEEPIMEASPTPVPPLDATGSSSVPAVVSLSGQRLTRLKTGTRLSGSCRGGLRSKGRTFLRSTSQLSASDKDIPDVAYGLFLCRGDVAIEDCRDCVANTSAEILLQCSGVKEAIIWSIFSRVEEKPMLQLYNPQDVTDPGPFNELVVDTMNATATLVANEARSLRPKKKISRDLKRCTV
ncbi:hypothetical protein AAG906_036853 [Vitis piasezkii]